MKKSIYFVLILLLIAAVASGYYWYITRDRRMVVRLVKDVVSLLEKKPSNLPHAGVLKYTKVDDCFDHSVKLYCPKPSFDAVKSREELKAMYALVNKYIDEMHVEVENVEVGIVGKEAVFSFDAEFSGVVGGRKEDFDNVYQVSGTAVKKDGKWWVSSLIAEEIIQ